MTQRDAPILLVEDNPDDAELARRVFEKCDISNVQIVGTGQAALDYVLGRGAWEGQGVVSDLKVILLDLKLPGISGIDVLHQLKADTNAKQIPIVVLTMTGLEQKSLEQGPFKADAYMRKPLEPHAFLQVYRSLVPLPS